MSVWYCIPSARPDGGTIPLWRSRGYRVAAWRDPGAPQIEADIILAGEYPGYAVAVNTLVREVSERYPETEWLVTGGDDVEPDLNHAPEEIARDCSELFSGRWFEKNKVAGSDFSDEYMEMALRMSTFGVMQPTGDRFAGGSIDRIAGSPWMGAEFCRRMYGGNGPLYEGYEHCFEDEELQEVAIMLGAFWQRRDLIHLHKHFMRQSNDINSPAVHKPTPPHLLRWTSVEHWNQSKALFMSRKQAGFPGHAPLPVGVRA